MTRQLLFENIRCRKSFLCVGLDSDIRKLPKHLLENEDDPVFAFNRAIIDATADVCVAYKPNLAFYECNGLAGWKSYERTIQYLHNHYPTHFIIADAKRGDIGNTSQMYARSFFEEQDVDAVTVAPYMGEDSVTPFLGYAGKWVVMLALTSNKGSLDFQLLEDKDGERLFEKVLRTSLGWGNEDNMMYVVGATRGSLFEDVRRIVPRHFLLVPGVGAQGGSLEEVCRYGMNDACGLLVNSSRGIIFADSTERFADVAREKAAELQQQMENLLRERGLL
ncbi:MAG: orotidine-5'-phosphate decarboxylase [Bacteroidaceae bacterium]|nr:orotidine-5'-phosphate decarboxylase [Bacteroidaceae bacterium]